MEQATISSPRRRASHIDLVVPRRLSREGGPASAAAAVTLLGRSDTMPQYGQVYTAMLAGVSSGAGLR